MKNEKGITLIALVITIIVLLILAGVSISSIVGKNGIIDNAKDASVKTEVAQIKESISEEVLEKKIDNLGDGITRLEVDEILSNYGTVVEKESKFILTTAEKKHEIDVTDIYAQIKINPEELVAVDISLIEVGDYISNYPVTYSNVSDGYDWGNEFEMEDFNPSELEYDENDALGEEYTGWRVLSKNTDSDGNTYVKLISTGTPLNYCAEREGSIEGLLAPDFLTTQINSSLADNTFYKCGFDNIGEDTNLVNVFNNEFTESVQSLTNEDVDEFVGYDTMIFDYITIEDEEKMELFYDLIAVGVPATPAVSEDFLMFLKGNYINDIGEHCETHWLLGVRPVITLKLDVKFAEADTDMNGKQTWQIFR